MQRRDFLKQVIRAHLEEEKEAIRQAVETSETEMAKITGGAGLPGMF